MNSDSGVSFLNAELGIIDSWAFSLIDRTHSTYSALGGKVCKYIAFSIPSGQTINGIVQPMFTNEGDTTREFEPYTGGEPAPNPKYPIEIKNTGDNGSVNEKVQNKNLFDYENYTYDKTIFNAYRFIEIKNVKSNTKYTIYNYNKALTGFDNVFFANDANYSSIKFGTQIKNVDSRQVTTNDLGKLYLCTYATSWNETLWNTFIKNFENAMFVEGTDISTSYVPHSEQNISFPLAEGQKFYEGSYPDDDEKVHHKMGEVVLIDEYISSLITLNNGNKALTIKLPNKKRTTGNYLLCNKAINNLSFNDGTFYENNTNIVLIGNENDNLETLKEKYNGAVFEYILAEEQTEDFTEEQQTAWEQIKKARTYKNVTHISSEDETPATVELEYVRDLETVINNLSN